MASARKPHVWVSQDTILDALREVGPSRLDDIAEFLDVSEASVRRKLDGAVEQGKATRWDASPNGGWSKTSYGALDEDGEIIRPVDWPSEESLAEARRQETLDRLEGRSS